MPSINEISKKNVGKIQRYFLKSVIFYVVFRLCKILYVLFNKKDLKTFWIINNRIKKCLMFATWLLSSRIQMEGNLFFRFTI